mgnify:CR=1 FL=1
MIGFIVNLIIMIALLVGGVFFIYKQQEKLKGKVINILIPAIIFLFLLYQILEFYCKGIDWNFYNSLPTANISPFMFTLLFINVFLPKPIKKYIYTLTALLCIGMVIAGFATDVSYIVRGYSFHICIAMDCTNHILFALFGIYLVITKQTHTKIRDNIISGSILFGIVAIMIILNIIFKTSFFGLNMYGDHSIYGVKLVSNSILSAVIYCCGLGALLVLGYVFEYLFVLPKLLKIQPQEKQGKSTEVK